MSKKASKEVEPSTDAGAMHKAMYGSADRPLKVADAEISCYVLDNDMRVVTQSGLLTALGLSYSGFYRGGDNGVGRLEAFISQKHLQEFLDLPPEKSRPIKFKARGRVVYGYDATILVDICQMLLAARRAKKLIKTQEHLAERAELLLMSFAKVGVIALVDEATGYQDIRARDELSKILQAYISPELLPWTRRFPPDFYKEMFRLRGWKYNPASLARPSVVGTYTNQLIYEKLPKGVLDALRTSNPKNEKGNRSYKHHQFLTEDIGNQHLGKHLAAVLALMRAASNWRIFMTLFNRSFGGQLDLSLDGDE